MKKIMVFGTFDIVHQGHLSMLKQAKKYAKYLIAVVARDKNVRKKKKHWPLNSEKERKDFLQHIDLIDRVVLGDKTDLYKIIRKEKPDLIALGYDHDENEKELQKRLKIRVVRLKPFQSKKYGTSKIKKHIQKYL